MAGEKVSDIPKLLKDARERQYLPAEKLGTGGFATCWKARMIDRRETPEATDCALKAVRAVLPKNIAWRFKLELAIQSKLHHPNIVELYRAFTYQDVTYVALELCPNGSLNDMIKKRKFLTMGEIRRILIQLCGAVKYLHERDVVHRDIKAGNIFLDEEMNVKLGDFGLAAIMEPGDVSEHARRTTFCGTPNYLAPEILCKATGHGISVDIWAVGVLAYFLAVGKAPFSAKTKEEIYEKLRKGDYSWPELAPDQNEIPEDLRTLVASLLVEESKRPTPDQVVRHPFFTCGFIPSKLDPLCKTRRPRYARVGTISENAKTYEALCRSSRVGLVSNTSATQVDKRRSKSVAIALAEEYALGVKLTIPLKEGIVYMGRKSPVIPATFEDEEENRGRIMSESNLHLPQPGVLTDRGANRGTKVPKVDQKKIQGTPVEILLDQEEKFPGLREIAEERQEKFANLMPKKSISLGISPPEHNTKNTETNQKAEAVQRLVKAVQSQSRIDRQGSYRLKVEPKEQNIDAGKPPPLTTVKDKVESEHGTANIPARRPLTWTQNVLLQSEHIPNSRRLKELLDKETPRPDHGIEDVPARRPLTWVQNDFVQSERLPQTRRLKEVLDRPRSQITSSMRAQSPPQDRKHNDVVFPVELQRSEIPKPVTTHRSDSANSRPEDTAVTKISTSRTYHPLTKPDTVTTAATLEPSNATSSSNPMPPIPNPHAQTPKPNNRTTRRKPAPITSPAPAPARITTTVLPRSRNPSASLAAAAAATAMHHLSSSSNNLPSSPRPSPPPQARQPSVSSQPLVRARTLRERLLFSKPAPPEEPVQEAQKPIPWQPAVTGVPARARTFRVAGERPRRLAGRGLGGDEDVAAAVEREIVERLKGVQVNGVGGGAGGDSAGLAAEVGLGRVGGMEGCGDANTGTGIGTGTGVRRARTLRAAPSRPRRAGVNYGGGRLVA